jgi:hypothetical protein
MPSPGHHAAAMEFDLFEQLADRFSFQRPLVAQALQVTLQPHERRQVGGRRIDLLSQYAAIIARCIARPKDAAKHQRQQDP